MRRQVSLLSMGTPPPIEIASLSMPDTLILMVMALVFFGPRRLPQLGRQIGKLMYEFRKASNDFKFQMEEELRASEEADRRKKEEERLRTLAPAPVPAPIAVEAAADIGAPGTEENLPVPQPSPETEENLPRILPPSTGETVPASRPHSQPEQPLAPSIEEIAAAAREQAQTEIVNHNG
jgi:sec-independent protein translocase protein TatB